MVKFGSQQPVRSGFSTERAPPTQPLGRAPGLLISSWMATRCSRFASSAGAKATPGAHFRPGQGNAGKRGDWATSGYHLSRHHQAARTSCPRPLKNSLFRKPA